MDMHSGKKETMNSTHARKKLQRLGDILSQPGHADACLAADTIIEIRQILTALDEHIQKQARRFQLLTGIGLSLSSEKNISDLLENILSCARQLTNADAGTLYLLEHEQKILTFEIVQNQSMNIMLRKDRSAMDMFSPVNLEINGQPNKQNVSSHVALSGDNVNIQDAYQAEGFDFSGTRAYDEKSGYRSRSMLVIPMKNHEGTIIGVLQLINAIHPDTGETISFSSEHEETVSAVASQAAIAITKTRLIKELEDTLDRLKIMHEREKQVLEEKTIIEQQRAQSLANLALSVSHQIRNPIMTIGGFINLTRRNLGNPEKIGAYLDCIMDAAHRLQSMSRSVEKYASIGDGQIRKISVASFVQPACEDILTRAKQSGLCFDIVREGDFEQTVMADPDQMKEAVSAVLENALEFGSLAEKNGSSLHIIVNTTKGLANIIISDQGKGIPEESMPYIFDPFFTTRADKAGMGLTIARRVLMANRGDIEVSSVFGKGTRVTLILNMPEKQ